MEKQKPTLEEFKKQQWEKLKDKPSGMAGTWAWNIRMDKEYKKKYQCDVTVA